MEIQINTPLTFQIAVSTDNGHTIKAKTVYRGHQIQKTLVKFCLSYDLKMHKLTAFGSLKVRFDNLISRKMDLSDFEMMQHGKLDYEGIQFWLTPPLLAWRLENCLTSNPVIYLSTYVAKHFLTEWNSGCDVTSVP